KLGRDLGVALSASPCPPIDDGGGSAFNPTEFVQPLHKRRNIRSPGRRRGRPQEPDGLSRLLRARRERPPPPRAPEGGQQFPPADGDCHTPLPYEVRKDNDTTPRACCP